MKEFRQLCSPYKVRCIRNALIGMFTLTISVVNVPANAYDPLAPIASIAHDVDVNETSKEPWWKQEKYIIPLVTVALLVVMSGTYVYGPFLGWGNDQALPLSGEISWKRPSNSVRKNVDEQLSKDDVSYALTTGNQNFQKLVSTLHKSPRKAEMKVHELKAMFNEKYAEAFAKYPFIKNNLMEQCYTDVAKLTDDEGSKNALIEALASLDELVTKAAVASENYTALVEDARKVGLIFAKAEVGEVVKLEGFTTYLKTMRAEISRAKKGTEQWNKMVNASRDFGLTINVEDYKTYDERQAWMSATLSGLEGRFIKLLDQAVITRELLKEVLCAEYASSEHQKAQHKLLEKVVEAAKSCVEERILTQRGTEAWAVLKDKDKPFNVRIKALHNVFVESTFAVKTTISIPQSFWNFFKCKTPGEQIKILKLPEFTKSFVGNTETFILLVEEVIRRKTAYKDFILEKAVVKEIRSKISEPWLGQGGSRASDGSPLITKFIKAFPEF